MAKKQTLELSDHRDCEALTGLAAENARRAGTPARVRSYRKGADVWKPDDRSDSIFFLQQGQVAIVAGDLEGREVMLGVIKVGEAFGELCVCAPGKRFYRETFARATAESEVAEVKLADFMGHIQSDRDALTSFVFTCCVRLSDAQQRLEILAHRGAEERLGRLLLHLANTGGQPSAAHEAAVMLSVSHDELAQMAAMSRPHVTVTMGRLRRHGLVGYGRNRPLVVNVNALTKHLTGRAAVEA